MGKSILFRSLIMVAIGLIVVIYFSPIWWVSLKAPNYPPEAFPDGIRIHFHIDGVFNGCRKRETEEIQVGEGLDCLHEMDTINHYVGMYPIASGGIIERTLSQFLFSFLIVLLIAFMMNKRKLQVSVLTLGFATIIAWSYVTLFTPGGIKYMSTGYQQALQVSMDMEPDEFQDWSGMQAMQENYQDSLGRFFRDKVKIEKQTNTLITIANIIIVVLLFSMLFIIGGTILKNNLFYWLLIIIPILLPVFFIFEYAGWLWWFGHNLHDMAAFTLKPFMPTVLGEGKVAQFSTHSYPHYGFFLIMLSSLLLLIAGLIRRKQLSK
ncbi:hypothetical protein QUF74_08330 [Candidatus Halobeggiatoa sp. HSG11]|nr:hypothetical protein [Candidatus Halobeggiatoa sp. HSG11]